MDGNVRKHLNGLDEVARRRIIDYHLANGVDIPFIDGVVIGPEVEIGAGTLIMPSTIILGKSKIGKNCVIGPQSKIEDCEIGDSSIVDASRCEGSRIGRKVKLGPYSHLRPGCEIADGAHAGNFVEIKNSSVGTDTKISHLTYVGDSDVGNGVNIGCGCATANYDGTRKFRTTVGDKAFIGCHTCLVAPVKVGRHAYTAAGSVVTEDVPEGTMAIARSRQSIKRKVRKYNED